jgi:hypothetical protein
MKNRVVVGFVAAALFPAAAFGLLSPAIEGNLISGLGLVPIFFFFSGVATAVLGVPAFLLLNHFGMVRWWSAIASGIVIGTVVALAIRLPNVVQPRDLLVMVPMGGVSALIFWLIWRPGHAA